MKPIKIEVEDFYITLKKGNSVVTLSFDTREEKQECLDSLINKLLLEAEND